MRRKATLAAQAVMLAMLAAIGAQHALHAAEPEAVVRIPFVVGLSTVRAAVTPQGDYETLRVIDSIDANGYGLVASGEVPADDGSGLLDLSIRRTVRNVDRLNARKMRVYFHSSDQEVFPGTVPGFSAAVVNELRKHGKAAFTYLDVTPMFGMARTRELTGTLLRVGTGATLPMLVNGRRQMLPVIHAEGTLTDGEGEEEFEYDLIDDPENPIVLRSKGAGASTRLIRIEYPERRNAATSMETALAANDPALVYGIYFSFARADIRKESDRVLSEIASIMKDHPDWKLRIDGHTDNVGDDARNLDLSKRRAAAVKASLVDRFQVDAARLSTGGYGESSPREKNDTPEGRARNRRVELRRQ